MSNRDRMMHLGMFYFTSGHHRAGWRHPDAHTGGPFHVPTLQQTVRTLERAKFDFVFLADFLVSGYHSSNIVMLEPLTLLSNLAAVTERIGLVATASTTYDEPYRLARAMASLDHLSGGRAGWNVVTSSHRDSAKNFGKDEHMDHALRYERAREFVKVAKGLWDSWEDDAFPMDQASGVFVDTTKRHVLDHKGEHFSVAGPLNIARSPQGYPVIVQAGSSEPGQELGAELAEVIFTAQDNIAEARAFYAAIKGRLGKNGRKDNDMLVMPGVLPIIGGTESEARGKLEQLQALVDADTAVDLTGLSGLIGADLSAYPLDGPLPELPETGVIKSRSKLLRDIAKRNDFTIRQLNQFITVSRGHFVAIGSPEQVADKLEQWFLERGADGFNVMPPHMPGGLDDFAEQVVPLLQKRGLFRTEYGGSTLRDHLGLARPANRHAASASGESVSSQQSVDS
ncbi:LLM class flavin-dependent oxidoreductase [Paenibacillus hemerocallicola]|uniref:LLM class flavin-dependent oxidoreductase n=1 Tax=Paenibacillus hemerocallicola TaxID=1172614 RepID=A0A5C4SZW9_9BACL|nr:LLM class flavin-dependent oxidoreductase [Paenibacillus hemerocallicola]TNJ62352.1 LLM class flavin-dependent oxidoreductase [Paenibacillus hemerocallicola]